MGRGAEGPGKTAIAGECIDGGGEGAVLAAIVEQAAALVFDDRSQAGVHVRRIVVRYQGRAAAIHPLANDVRVRVVVARRRDGVGGGVPRGDVALLPGEVHPRGDPACTGALLEKPTLRSDADNQQSNGRVHLRQLLDGKLEGLETRERADHQQAEIRLRQIERRTLPGPHLRRNLDPAAAFRAEARATA